jgi:lysophospholipase L1-like esterase
MNPYTRVIIGDSIVKEIRHIRDCNIISLSGITLDELHRFINRIRTPVEHAQTVLIHCGTNDTGSSSVLNIVEKFKNIIHLLKSLNGAAKILISAILPRLRDDVDTGPNIKLINFELRSNCRTWGAEYIASNRLLLHSGKPVAKYYCDGIHLSSQGTKRLRQFFSQKMAELGTKPVEDLGTATYLRRPEWSNWS